MITDERLLWKNIHDFPLDDASSALTFTQRLARENNWNLHFAERVTTAYKNFIFLCMVSPQQVTPPDAVDQAWHLHMTYTQSYWNELCAKVLGKPLHHHPTRGGDQENEKFFAQYEATLQLYREKLGEEPPEDIWPPAEKRFAAGEFVRVSKKAHWVVKKPKRDDVLGALGINSIGTIIGLFTGSWIFFGITAVVSLIAFIPIKGGGGDSKSGCGSGGCGAGCGADGHSGCGGDSGCGGGCGGGD
jgi:hypothetical protein